MCSRMATILFLRVIALSNLKVVSIDGYLKLNGREIITFFCIQPDFNSNFWGLPARYFRNRCLKDVLFHVAGSILNNF